MSKNSCLIWCSRDNILLNLEQQLDISEKNWSHYFLISLNMWSIKVWSVKCLMTVHWLFQHFIFIFYFNFNALLILLWLKQIQVIKIKSVKTCPYDLIVLATLLNNRWPHSLMVDVGLPTLFGDSTYLAWYVLYSELYIVCFIQWVIKNACVTKQRVI